MRATQTHDKTGREYVKLSQLKAGDEIELDDGFDCAPKGKTTVFERDGRLYFKCWALCDHFIDSQCYGDTDHCVGIYPA